MIYYSIIIFRFFHLITNSPIWMLYGNVIFLALFHTVRCDHFSVTLMSMTMTINLKIRYTHNNMFKHTRDMHVIYIYDIYI